MKEVSINILTFLGLAWWVEIVTEAPNCTYYFGPFANVKEAKSAQSGYVEDLEQEGAKNIKVAVKRCKPDKLTIFDDSTEPKQRQNRLSHILTGQA
ncbi:MAG: DUF1816 domain-containing protein [Leptolyngbyaceae cyanobacterium CRU_2_3]|nr:DUF1816 domain-containing protein [Leptolyngbyaceae cyanobacterium CRU_2_3]